MQPLTDGQWGGNGGKQSRKKLGIFYLRINLCMSKYTHTHRATKDLMGKRTEV